MKTQIFALIMAIAMIGVAGANPESTSTVVVSGGVVTVHSDVMNSAYQQQVGSHANGVLVGIGSVGTTGAAGSDYESMMDRTRWTQASISLETTNKNSGTNSYSSIIAGMSDSGVDSSIMADITQNLFLPLSIETVTGASFNQEGVGVDNEVEYQTYANADLTGAGFFAVPTTYVYGESNAVTGIDGVVGTSAGDVTEIGHREVYTNAFVTYNFFDLFD